MARTSYDRLVDHADDFTEKLEKRKRFRTMVMVCLPFLAIIFFMAATRGGDGRNDAGAYDAATLWADHGPASYSLTYSLTTARGVFGPATITVVDGLVTEYETASPELEDARHYTVDTLLFTIEDLARGPESTVLSVDYHPELGYPRAAEFDPALNVADDEWSVAVLDFEPLD